MIIVVCPRTGDRLCRDGQWRSFAHFGTGRTCVREYKVAGWALKAGRKAYRWTPEYGETFAKCVYLHGRDTMSADGRIVRESGRVEYA